MADSSRYNVIPATPGWWGRFTVTGESAQQAETHYAYEPVAFWLVSLAGESPDVDALRIGASGAVSGGFDRLARMPGFQGFVYEPTRVDGGRGNPHP